MSFINILLGQYNRKGYNPNNISKSALIWECDKREVPFRTHYNNSQKNFSNHTERDEINIVGKLYKGYVDEDGISQEQSGPKLVKKRIPPRNE